MDLVIEGDFFQFYGQKEVIDFYRDSLYATSVAPLSHPRNSINPDLAAVGWQFEPAARIKEQNALTQSSSHTLCLL